MKALKRSIIYFLEDHLPQYINPHGVDILWHGDNSVTLNGGFPGYKHKKNTSLCIFCDFETLEEFFAAFEIENVRNLGKIKPADVEKRYSEGKGEINCMVNGNDLTFKKKGSGMEVLDNEHQIHEIENVFTNPKEFISYTKNYYMQKLE